MSNTFPYKVGDPIRGMIPVARLANGEVTEIADRQDGRKTVSARFRDGTESSYIVSATGHCDYLSPGHFTP